MGRSNRHFLPTSLSSGSFLASTASNDTIDGLDGDDTLLGLGGSGFSLMAGLAMTTLDGGVG